MVYRPAMVGWLAVSAGAATWGVSEEGGRVRQEGPFLWQGECVPVLEQAYHDLEHLSPDEVYPDDVHANGARIVTDVFEARLALQDRLRAWVSAGTLTADCMRSLRRADIAGRYLEDYVIGFLTP